MPQSNKAQVPVRHIHDPLTACLDADGTYICTAYNSRCYIIQKCSPLSLVPSAEKQTEKNSTGAGTPKDSSNTPKVAVAAPLVPHHLLPRRNICKLKVSSGNNDNLSPGLEGSEGASKRPQSTDYEMVESDFPPLEGNVYMNGDVGKVPSGAVFTASPEPQTSTPTSDFSLLNGSSEVEGKDGGLDTFGGEGGAGVGGDHPPDPQPPIPLDQLKQMLSSQLEYYFSRENLANDTYLLSQMDNDQYVPIWTVANFNQVKKLTTDIKLITEVLRESPNVQVDDEGIKVRPNHKRCIVILREIPDSTPLEEVKGLFSGKGCPKLISCEFAHNNSWYVTFENDEDAQKAYRFLREEVREFQGKPIMARIKAKPMNRLPLPPGIGAGGIGLKNGFRTPPAPASTGPGVFEPPPFPQPAQRYLFSNGSSLPPNVNYANQVQIYVSNFQQHQPFYHPSMLPTWGPTSPAFYDIGSVFSVNGLAPQGGPFTKSHTTRFTPRNSSRQKKPGLEGRSAMSDSGIVRKPVAKDNTRFESTENQRHDDDSYRSNQSKDQVLPPRRRRKEDETCSRTSGSPGPQFDLEADAFPPLPGGDPPSGDSPSAHQPSPASASNPASVEHAQWAENRLSDVVKGSVKGRLTSSDEGCSNGNTTTEEKGRTSPSHPTTLPRASPSIPILPPTPDKPRSRSTGFKKGVSPICSSRTVIGIGGVKGPPEKGQQVKSEERQTSGQVNGDGEREVKLSSPLPPPASSPDSHLFNHQPAVQAESGIVKLSYAQVAQHHHKERLEREKTSQQNPAPIPPQQPPAPPQQPQLQPTQHHSDDEKKDHPPPSFHYQVKGDGLGSRGRGGARGGAPRRRDNIPRQFNSRQRSPK